MEKNLCNFCRKNEMSGVYAADHGPFSLGYCNKCLKHPNIRTMGNAISKYGRFGEDSFNEYVELNGVEPNVYLNDKYITLREMVKIIKIEEVEDYINKEHPVYLLFIDRLKNERV